MAARLEAVWRLIGLVYLATIFPFVAILGSAAAFLYMVIDVVLQLVTGGEGLSTGSGWPGWLAAIYEWGIAQMRYIFFGKGTFPILP